MFLLDEEYDYDFKLYGVSCHEKDYRLCWGLNKYLNLNFSRARNDVEVKVKKTNRLSLHSFFTFFDEDSEMDYTLISNRSTMGYLIPEKPQADYLILVKENYFFDEANFVARLKEIPFVLMAFEINVFSLKSKENLIF